jgi:hypothetical protein
MDFDSFGLEPEHGLILRGGSIQLALIFEHIAEIGRRLGVIRLERDRISVMLRRLFEPPAPLVRQREVVLPFRTLAIDRAACPIMSAARSSRCVCMPRIPRL